MAFIKERISDEDFERYHITKTGYGNRAETFRYWVIDRKRDIYLRRNNNSWQRPSDRHWWFYWKGEEGNVNATNLTFVSGKGKCPNQENIRISSSSALKKLLQDEAVRHDFMEAYCADEYNANTITIFDFF